MDTITRERKDAARVEALVRERLAAARAKRVSDDVPGPRVRPGSQNWIDKRPPDSSDLNVVYLVRDPVAKALKIGTTSEVCQRMGALGSTARLRADLLRMVFRPLRLLATRTHLDPDSLEADLKKKFERYRVGRSEEWFSIEPEILREFGLDC